MSNTAEMHVRSSASSSVQFWHAKKPYHYRLILIVVVSAHVVESDIVVVNIVHIELMQENHKIRRQVVIETVAHATNFVHRISYALYAYIIDIVLRLPWRRFFLNLLKVAPSLLIASSLSATISSTAATSSMTSSLRLARDIFQIV